MISGILYTLMEIASIAIAKVDNDMCLNRGNDPAESRGATLSGKKGWKGQIHML